jgi:hypothetical protein
MKTAIQFAFIAGLLSGLYSCTPGLDPNSPKVLLPAGTLLKVSLVDPLRSDTSSPGDVFLVSMAEPVVMDGATVLDSQTFLWGKVVDSVESGRIKGSAGLQLTLIDITQSERTIPIVTNTFTAGPRIMRGGLVEAAESGIRRVPFLRENIKVPIGVLTTAAADSGVILGTREREIYFGPETRLNFTLLSAVEL